MHKKHLFISIHLLCLLLSFSLTSISQQLLKEVTLLYDITISSNNNKSTMKSLEGATLMIYVKGNLCRTDMNSAIGKESNVYNSLNKEGYILKEFSGQKLLIKLKESNWNQRNKFYASTEFEYLNQEKTINGFICKQAKALSSLANLDEVYFLSEKKINNTDYYSCFSRLQGVPVKYSIRRDDKVVTYTLRSVNTESIPLAVFEEPKGGYRKLTYEEAGKIGDKE